ncbi:hypothetical protein RJ640_004726 [Escallonia rubra]|uniref:SURP motif domain-containing protein n=1 Tax=Escallonia rubra TaxID=112253 RepID=A0AA88U4K9_9ASTE|nr:hypothetical protein RJ640_004726 [Escallonia rubra]
MEVEGRHALLFDDDATAAFVNSADALVEWNSLSIDRYDVRHLLSGPPPPRRRRHPQQTYASSVTPLEAELDLERYLDLPLPSDERVLILFILLCLSSYSESDESNQSTKPVDAGGYSAVPFSYGNIDDSNGKDADSGLGCPGFRPPFPVPESLLQSLPPTEKVHQIIARTAMFVSKHGGQSEIILRVKQGDNPTFGFLMPDHQLHAYFRFLVDNQELLRSDVDGKPQNGEKISDMENGVGGGALSLLGSMYGSGEDEDAAVENASESLQNVLVETVNASETFPHKPENIDKVVKDEAVSKHLLPSKEKAPPVRKSSSISTSKVGSTGTVKKEGESSSLLSAASNKLQVSSLPATSEIEPLVLEPPSDLKRLIDKIVEFILKNGKQFEAVLAEQDSAHGRFPFLLPSNQYHPYYLKALQNAQELKITGKSFLSGKDRLVGHGQDKRTSVAKGSDTSSLGSDIPYDSDRKEKFKMVLGKSKKDGQEPPPKATQQQFGVRVDAAAAAAILQAATRGIKNPNLGFFSSTSINGNSHDHSSEGGQASSVGGFSSQPESTIPKSENNGEHIVPVPAVKAIAKTAALEAAGEADSSEAHLTREQQLKAERLKRAKMFVAMLKSGAAAPETEPLRGLSVERQESGVSGSAAETKLIAKEREGSSAPTDIATLDSKEVSERKHSGDEFNNRRSKRKYRSRSSKHVEDEKEDDEEEIEEHKEFRKKHRSHRSSFGDDCEEQDEEERNDRHSRKKHRRRHSSPEVEEEQNDEVKRDRHYVRKKHRSHRSSRDDSDEEDLDERDHNYVRKKHRSHRSSHDDSDEEDIDERDHRSFRKKHRSHRSSRHSRDDHKHKKRYSSKERESRRKHDISSDEEHRRYSRSDKHRKGSQLEKEELEEGEISSKTSDQSRASVGAGASREASVDLLSSYRDGRAPSQPSETTEVSDDLRAKVRAMLMATL